MDTKWKPGVSGNPGGRPKGQGNVRELAQQHTEEAVSTLVEIMKDKKAPPAARATASSAILDRGWGRPVQEIATTQKESFVDAIRLCQERHKEWENEKADEARNGGFRDEALIN